MLFSLRKAVLLHKWEFKNIEVEFLKVSEKIWSPGLPDIGARKSWDFLILTVSASTALPYDSGKYYGLILVLQLSVCHMSSHLLYLIIYQCFHFQTITWVNINRFSPNLVYAMLLWRSGFWLLLDKFNNFDKSYLFVSPSVVHPSVVCIFSSGW